MATDKKSLLENFNIGGWVAEDEEAGLESFFINTQYFLNIAKDSADILVGPTGSGKTAAYLTLANTARRHYGPRVIPIQIDSTQNNLVFQQTRSTEFPDDHHYKNFWLLIFIVEAIRSLIELGIKNREILQCALYLRSLRMLESNIFSFYDMLKFTANILKNYTSNVSYGAGTIIIKGLGFIPGKGRAIGIDQLLRCIYETCEKDDRTILICIDRLDAMFQPKSSEERLAIRGLLQAFQDVRKYSERIKLKLFLRTDIRDHALSGNPFREARHLSSRASEINWKENDLFKLLIHRIASNPEILQYLSIGRESLLSSSDAQHRIFYTLFPNNTSSETNLFSWTTKMLRDGKGNIAPRDLLHVYGRSIDIQKAKIQNGIFDLPGALLVEFESIMLALQEVSVDSLSNRLYAENPFVRRYVSMLQRGRITHNKLELADKWELGQAALDNLIDHLVEAGFFRRTSEDRERPFVVSELYRQALNLS